MLSYFEYVGVAHLKKLFLKGKEKENFSQLLTTTQEFCKQFEVERDTVVLNIPPAYVHHLKLAEI